MPLASFLSPPLTEAEGPHTLLPLPLHTRDRGPLALTSFEPPPVIAANVPLASFLEPPLTEAEGPLALLKLLPLTEAYLPLTPLPRPPLTVEKMPLA